MQMATSGTLALLMYLHVVQVWHILLLSSVTGLAQAFGGPAYQSLIPSLVDKKDLPNAVALNSIQFNVARVLGPLLFGATLVVFTKWGYNEPQAMNACFALNALSFVVVINTLMMLRVKHIPPAASKGMRDELQSGLSYVRHHPSLKAFIVLAAATTFLGFALLTFLPVFAQQVFHEGAGTYSRLMAFSGAGSIVGALIVAWLGKFKRMGLTALLVQAVYGVLIVAFAVIAHSLAERHPAVPHRRGADDGVLDGDVARPDDRAQRDARARDEHLHARVPRRHAARQPRQRLLRDAHRRADRHRHQRRPARRRRGVFLSSAATACARRAASGPRLA